MSVTEVKASHRQIRVLVADDDPLLRSLVAANLVRRADEVVEAADGEEAWDLLLSRTFELALIDLSMPNIDGFTLIQCMRGHPRTRHMPIIVITSSKDGDSIERAFQAGATSFLTKPVNWSLFGHHIDYLIRLNEGGETARAVMRQAEAVGRAKDAVIAALTARIREHVDRVTDAALTELRPRQIVGGSATGADFARGVLAEATAITDMCDATLPQLRTVTEQIVVGDRPVSLDRIIDRSIEQVARLAQSRGVRIEVVDFDVRATIECDESAITTALGNLLRNAVQHSASGTAVTLSVDHRADNALAIAVTDQGPGADPGVIAAALMPFDQRVVGVVAGGTLPPAGGLGLPMAKAIAQAHGGTIEVLTAPGHGATATLIMPSDVVEVGLDNAA